MKLVKGRRNAVVVGNIWQGCGRFFELIREIGVAGALVYVFRMRGLAILQCLGFDPKRTYFSLRTKDAEYPLYVRYGTSDLDVFEQVFVNKKFLPLKDITTPRLIIDCGSYVGYSTVYFLNKFPSARLIAIEPDSANFVASKKNLYRYGDRVTLLNSAIWVRKVGLIVVRGMYLDGREWATQVRECTAGETPDVVATDMKSLIDEAGFSQVDLLKVDIEASELVLFGGNCAEWLDKVRNIAIELHDVQCSSVFFNALSRYSYDFYRYGELIICKNSKRKSREVREADAKGS